MDGWMDIFRFPVEQSVRLWHGPLSLHPEDRLPGRLLSQGLTSSTRGQHSRATVPDGKFGSADDLASTSGLLGLDKPNPACPGRNGQLWRGL